MRIPFQVVREWIWLTLAASVLLLSSGNRILAQGVTTGSVSGSVTDDKNNPLYGANVTAVHEASGTYYGAVTTASGAFTILNMRIGGPYTVKVSFMGFKPREEKDIHISLGQTVKLSFRLTEEAIAGEEIIIVAEKDEVMNRDRTGAATHISTADLAQMPSIKRSTTDLTRLDPRSDGSFSFGGRNWLFNNYSLDGSYFNNSFGLDNPAPGGQTNAEPVSFDAIEEVQVSIAPFDVREGGFTGANINSVTKSGSNTFTGSLYSYYRDKNFIGNEIKNKQATANPDLSFTQSGFTLGGPVIKDKLFFFLNAEIERRTDPGSNFTASRNGSSGFGISRVDAAIMDQIRQRMKDEYGYDTGEYEKFDHKTGNEKLLFKLDWNATENHKLSFRYNRLRASQDKPPHPFVLSPGGRGPNESSLPFQNSGYEMNNGLNSFALEANSHFSKYTNRFFASYSRFRDFRDPFSKPFPTIDIAENGVTYTTVGHEPFSIHNILDQDVWQVTNNFSYFTGKHVMTAGVNFEYFGFFNSFNIFRHGVFFLPYGWFPGTARFSSVADFLAATDPGNPSQADFNSFVAGDVPFKGEDINVGQLAFYVQDEYSLTDKLKLTAGLRADIPMYFTEPKANPFSTDSIIAWDENDKVEKIDQAKLPSGSPLFSPRIGFNYDMKGDRSTQFRGGTGIFTGRLPFVWIGNVISNPGANPNLPAQGAAVAGKSSKDDIPTQSFDLNAMVKDFKWPQVWTTNIAIDHKLPWDLLGTLEFIYSKDINAVYMRNADIAAPVRNLADGRPYYGSQTGSNELNPDGGAGIYVIDNSSKGYNYNITAQLKKTFPFGLSSGLAYTFMESKSLMKSTEIASVLWAENPVQGDPNKPGLSNSEFGQRHRIVGYGAYQYKWNSMTSTSVGLFFEVAEGNTFLGAGGNRYSFVYAGDVNGDGSATNDLIYIPNDASEINLVDIPGGMTAAQQWEAFDAFIEQDDYLSKNRGKIAKRFGAVNPWYSNIDLKLMQEFRFKSQTRTHTMQVSFDILNLGNFINSNWGVRKVASSSATNPLRIDPVGGWNGTGEPPLQFVGPSKTFVNDPSILSRWRVQLGVRYMF
ncbi:TonB-dependent receptor [bacterium]|nr:TonB-dependent receptor [bacterium]